MVLPNISDKSPQILRDLLMRASRLGALDLAGEYSAMPCPEQLSASMIRHIRSGNNGYAPVEGTPQLREAISWLMEHLYSYRYDPLHEITVTAGATQAIYTAITSFIGEGDEVVMFEPAYECYAPAVLVAGGFPVFISLKRPGFRIDWEEVQKYITSRTRMIIINTPHNPTGTILSSFDMEKLQKIIQGTSILVLSDEVFEHVIFEGFEHQGVARFPELAQRSLVVSSFGKAFHITGWKVGFCCAPAELTARFRKMHQFVIQSVNRPVQLALAEYITGQEKFSAIGRFFQEKRDHLLSGLSGSRFIVPASAGTYFQLLDFSGISEESDTSFAMRLLEEYRITLLPLNVFYHDHTTTSLLRSCFARSNEELDRAAEIMNKI